MDIRILDGFMNISASSNCPQIPSNTPLLKEKKKKQKPKTSHHRTKEKAEVWRFCSFGDYFSSTSHSWKHCLCERWRTRDMISSLAPWSGSVLVTPSRSDPWWITWSLILALAKVGAFLCCQLHCYSLLFIATDPGAMRDRADPSLLAERLCLHLSDIRIWFSFLFSGSNFPISFTKFPSVHDL